MKNIKIHRRGSIKDNMLLYWKKTDLISFPCSREDVRIPTIVFAGLCCGCAQNLCQNPKHPQAVGLHAQQKLQKLPNFNILHLLLIKLVHNPNLHLERCCCWPEREDQDNPGLDFRRNPVARHLGGARVSVQGMDLFLNLNEIDKVIKCVNQHDQIYSTTENYYYCCTTVPYDGEWRCKCNPQVPKLTACGYLLVKR